MKKIKLLSMHIQNFKGCKDRKIEFGDKTRIFGANATGKTTVFDSFTWLLFGKDSLGSTDFDVRPLDADGKMINSKAPIYSGYFFLVVLVPHININHLKIPFL